VEWSEESTMKRFLKMMLIGLLSDGNMDKMPLRSLENLYKDKRNG